MLGLSTSTLDRDDTAARPPLPAAEADRVRLASNSGTPAATLHLLATDAAVTVRAAVAMNPAFAPAVQTCLAADADDRVRTLLAGKMARLLPGLSGPDQQEAQSHAHDVLLTLAADAAVRIRMTLVDVLRSMPEAPHAVIMRLAQDPCISVSEPVLRLSPLLTDADLLELLAAPPHPAAAVAMAGRTGLSHTVVDAIASAADATAIRALLMNNSASLREGTLDALIGRAGEHPEWHEPLIQRPFLAERAARALSMVVAGHLLQTLLQRADLPPGLVEEIRERLAAPLPAADEASLLNEIRALHGRGRLTEAVLVAAAEAGDAQRVAAILSVTGEISMERLQRSIRHRNAKGLTSLVWRAGFSAQTAALVQAVLCSFAPGDILVPGPEEAFSLSVSEMEWQIELLAEPGS